MQKRNTRVVYQTLTSRKRSRKALAGIVLSMVVAGSGCTGMNNAIPQALGVNSAARVPPPGTGSFSTPNNYTNSNNGAANPNGSPVNNGGFSNGNVAPGSLGPKTSFNPIEQPASQLMSTINNAQSRIQQVTTQARDSVNRTAEGINSRVEAAGGRIDRLGQGVVQAGAVLSEAAQPAIQTGNINDQMPNNFAEAPNASWRKPTR